VGYVTQAITFHQLVTFGVNGRRRVFNKTADVTCSQKTVRAKRNPKLHCWRVAAWGPGGRLGWLKKDTYPATSETFVAATLHRVLELTLRPRRVADGRVFVASPNCAAACIGLAFAIPADAFSTGDFLPVDFDL
jgi:hypothetical protein